MKIGDILTEFKAKPPIGDTPEVLTLTERNGFVRQSDRFNKRLATEDVSSYKFIERDEFAFNPYLLWAGALARNDHFDAGVISPLYPTFRVNPGFDPSYVIRILLADSSIKLYDGIAFGSVPRRRRSSVKDFLALDIPPLPPLVEQRRIADILDKTDVLRTKRREAIAHLDSLGQSIFHEMFGFPSRNEHGWAMQRIGDLLTSTQYGTSEKSESNGTVPVLRMGNLTYQGHLDLTDLKYLADGSEGPEKYLLRRGDVLFNRTNSVDLVGKTALFDEDGPFSFAGYLIRLRCGADLEPQYLTTFMNVPDTKTKLRSMCKSIVGMANINAKEVQAMLIMVPPLKLQQEFARRVAAIELLKASHRAQLIELDNLFLSLQDRAFRGEL